MTALLELAGVRVALGRRTVIDGADLAVHGGEVVGLLGANGAGKTTLMRAALGLLARSRGEVRLGGRPLDALNERDRAHHAAWLGQDRHVCWNLPAREVAALGAPLAAPAVARARAEAALRRVGVGHLAGRGVLDLSAGERARVLFARLLVAGARLILADEPVATIDAEGARLMLALLREEARAGAGVLVSLHDLGLAAQACDRVAVLANGSIQADGPPRAVLTPSLLAKAFGVDGQWIETPAGPALAILHRRAA